VATVSPSFLAILVSLAGGIYVGRSVLPLINQDREIARRVEILGREVAERGSSGLGTKVVDASMQRVPEILQAWQNLGVRPATTLPEAKPLPPGSSENLTTVLGAWQQSPSGALRAAQAAEAAVMWGRLDPQGAIAWVDKISDEAERAAARQGIAKGWGGVEPMAASEWVVTLPEGAERTAVVSAFAKAAGKQSPALALGFGLSVEDVVVRGEIVRAVLRSAAQRCPEEAEQQIQGAHLSNEERKDFLERLASYQTGGDQP
jgi:hypothetical protein